MTLELHIFISGRVQGGAYRANAVSTARRLGLVGWVRNLPDARVDLLAQGDEKALKSLLIWAHEGPALAQVEHVETHWGNSHDNPESFSDFQIRD